MIRPIQRRVFDTGRGRRLRLLVWAAHLDLLVGLVDLDGRSEMWRWYFTRVIGVVGRGQVVLLRGMLGPGAGTGVGSEGWRLF